MKLSNVIHSTLILIFMVSLTSCYTRLGYVSEEQVYEEYSQNPEDFEEALEDSEPRPVVIKEYVYVPSIYHPAYIYFDPYDVWYYEPGFHFWFGYYAGPVYIPTGAYYCYPPVYYPPYPYPPYYYPPFHHPYPVYAYPAPGGYHGHGYAHASPVMKRRSFARRGEQVFASGSSTVKRRGSDSSGQLTRRTSTNPPSQGDTDQGRRRIDKRYTKYNPTENPYYGRSSSRGRTSTNDTKKSTGTDERSRRSSSRKSYSTDNSNSGGSSYNRSAARQSSSSSRERVAAPSTRSSSPSSVRSSSSGSNSSGSSSGSRSTIRSSGSSRQSSAGISRSSSGGSSRSSSGSSSRSGSGSSGKSRKR